MTKLVYAIIGLPASGKSTLAWSMLDDGLVDYVVDDPRDIDLIKFAFEEYSTIAVTCPFLCDPQNLKVLVALADDYEFKVECLYFKNDPEQCKINAQNRSDKVVDKFIDRMSRLYIIPPTSTPLEVYSK